MFTNRKEAISHGESKIVEGFKNALCSGAAAQMFQNANGIEQAITTLTKIRSKITEQKIYEVKPSDFMPVVVGEGAYFDEQNVWTTETTGGDPESSVVDPNSNNGKFNVADAKLSRVLVKRLYWGETINYNVIEMSRAMAAGNFSAIEAKESARFKRWGKFVEKIAFLGSASDADVKGLLNQATVNSNTSVIDKDISSMNATEFNTFLKTVIAAYRSNNNRAYYPDTFVMPSDDFEGLGTAVDETYPLKSRLERMLETFKLVTGNANFEIKPLAYSMQENNGLSLNRYVMYNRSDDTRMYMDVPVQYTTTAQDTVNNFNYESVGYGQISGCNIIDPAVALYFDYAN